MANIDIFNLEPAGSELFTDSENFLTDLTEEESGNVAGAFFDYSAYVYQYQNINVNASFGNSNNNQVNITLGNGNFR